MKYIVLFSLLVLGFFYQTIVYHKLPVPSDTLVGLYHPWRDLYASEYPRGIPFKNFLITDPIRQQIPWRKLVIDGWKRGERPVWNPYAFAGVPLDANIQAAPYYPFNVLFLFLDFSVAWTILVMLQPSLAGVFLYFYLKKLKLSEAASIMGAIAWGFSGFSIAWLTWGTMMQTAMWLPLLLLAVDKNHRALFVFSATMAMFAGHIQIAVYVFVLALTYAFWRRKLGKTLPLFVFALLLTSVQLIPMVKFILESGRVGASDAWKAAGWFLPWKHIAQFIAPDFFGNPATMNYWGEWNYGEFLGYVGVVPIVLAGAAFFLPGIPRFFAAVIAVSLFFMLPHPVSRLPFQLHIPVISVLQPTRFMVLVDFSLAVLAAYGLHHLSTNIKKSMYVYGFLLIVLWVIALAGHIDVAKRNLVFPSALYSGFVLWSLLKKMPVLILLAFTLFDLFRFGWKFTPFTPKEYFFPTTKVIGFLQRQPKPFRVMSLDDRILPPNVSAYYGIETIEGYDPVLPKNYQVYLGSSGSNRILTLHDIDSPILPDLNIRYVLTLADIDRPFLQEVMREGETRVYEYMNAKPRAYIRDASGDETAQITQYSKDKMIIRSSTATDRELIILNRYDSRWKAVVDGNKVTIHTFQNIFVSITIPSGTHDVILSYQ